MAFMPLRQRRMDIKMAAIGLLETCGFTDAVEALDAMCKDARVELLEMKRIGGGLITIIIEGEVATVMSSVEAGIAVVKKAGGQIVCSNVIPNPHGDLAQYLKGGANIIE